MSKRFIVAKSAGFCFGVKRAVDMALDALSSNSESRAIYCLGQLIHNNAVSEMLAGRGLVTVDSVDEIPYGSKVVVRSHGASRVEFERLRAINAEITDATCPKVSRIHRIAEKAEREGRLLVIIGAADHPEVRAIRGWCSESVVFANAGELKEWLENGINMNDTPITVAFQTTQTEKIRKECREILKKLCTNCEIFDTICDATSVRQEEARALSSVCGAMVVIGGRNSANSIHLAEICGEYCKNVQFVEAPRELEPGAFDGVEAIGITAGASAPAWIIKEVKQKMSDEMKALEVTASEELTAGQTIGSIEAEAEPVIIDKEEAAEPANDSAETAVAVEAEAATEAEPAAEPESDEPSEPVEKSFAEMVEDSIKTINNGETVSGIVAAITTTEVSVDLGTKHSGYIPTSEFLVTAETKIEDLVQVGSRIEAMVVRVNDVEGTVMLSKKRLDAVKNWSDIEAAQEEGTAVEGTVTEENKGGVVVNVNGIRVFVPASQTGLPKDTPMTELLKTKVRLKITEVNRSRRRVVGSIRAIQFKERRERTEKIWNEIEVGKRYSGVVKSLTSYGAFVDIGGIDGMVHVSELSWSRIKQPSEVVSVGDEVEVYVINFDKENRKISLGYKDPEANPWTKFTNMFKVGDVAVVKIVKLMPFGAFAEVLPGVDGLIHISQIANHRIGKPDEVLTVGDLVDVKVTNIDMDKQKISLSIRAVSEPEPVRNDEPESDFRAKPKFESDALVYEVSESGQALGHTPEARDTENF